ncbi:hypothetical protein JKP88DRAFT_346810 [Tribonema minus]|uniref:Uncharacterized protein n=1 Tax=Tribonema minus TaxID=303371 RepID=A0A835YSG7_9STRA|nr:hypothetical protein JKP88DRAFT_346810 [Tribonema minus]
MSSRRQSCTSRSHASTVAHQHSTSLLQQLPPVMPAWLIEGGANDSNPDVAQDPGAAADAGVPETPLKLEATVLADMGDAAMEQALACLKAPLFSGQQWALAPALKGAGAYCCPKNKGAFGAHQHQVCSRSLCGVGLAFVGTPFISQGGFYPFECEVDYSGDFAQRKKDGSLCNFKCFDGALTPETASALVLQGVNDKRIPYGTMLEALACLQAHAKATDMVAETPLQGLYRLVFSAGSIVPELQPGRSARGAWASPSSNSGGLDMRLGAAPAPHIKIDRSGGGPFRITETISGLYSVEDGRLEAHFNEVQCGSLHLADGLAAVALGALHAAPVSLRTFFAQDGVMALHCATQALHCAVQDKEGVLVFQRDNDEGRSHTVSRVEANALKHATKIMAENRPQAAKPRADATDAEKAKARPTASTSSNSLEPVGPIPGNPVLGWLTTEIMPLYAMLAGPTLWRFVHAYWPIGMTKAVVAVHAITAMLDGINT